MVATIPAVPVPKPTQSFPLRYGLFAAANGPLDLPVHARNGGLHYETALCYFGGGYEIECVDDQNSKEDRWADNGIDSVVGAPFIVLSTIQCGSVGYTYEEQRAFMMERLKGVEQATVEGIISQGIFGQSPAFLTADGIETITGGGTTVAEVVGELESARYCSTAENLTQYGPVGHLHVSFIVFNQMKSDHLIEFDGTRWRTAAGTIVSPGCYANNDPDGVAPADGTFWLYMTGQVTVWRTPDSEVQIAPVEGSLDRTTNQFLMMAEREYVVTFECGGFAKSVTLWTP